MNYYPHHIGDFNNATRHLTRVERALYRELIDLYYDCEQPFKSDDFETICRKVLARCDEEKSIVRAILDEFFVLKDGFYHQERCDAEIAKYQDKKDQQSKAGKASAAARAKSKTGKKPTKNNGRSTGVKRTNNGRSTGEQPTKNQEPRTNNQEPNINTGANRASAKFDFSQWPSEPSPEILADWIKVRKAKKAELTQTAINRLTGEIKAAAEQGLSADDCIGYCCEFGWAGFQLDWLRNKTNNAKVVNFQQKSAEDIAYEEAMREAGCQ